MSFIKVSIIIPVYNTGLKLEKCIRSILDQSYSSIEIIIINDGSYDSKTLSLLEKLRVVDDRILIYNKENGGALSARLAGIYYATGEYIMFVDADDWIEDDMIQMYINTVKDYEYDFILGGLTVHYGKNKQKRNNIINEECINDNEEIHKLLEKYFINEAIYGPYCKLVKASILKKIIDEMKIYENIKLQEDLIMNIKILSYVNSIKVLEIYKYHYVINSMSVTTKYIENKLDMMISGFDEISKFYNDLYVISGYDELKFIFIKDVYAGFLNLHHLDCKLEKIDKFKFIEYWKLCDKTKKILTNIDIRKLSLKKRILVFLFENLNCKQLLYFTKILNELKKIGVRL